MNKTLNLNQEPKLIAEEAKEMFGHFGYIKRDDVEKIILAINLIENIKEYMPKTYQDSNDLSDQYLALSSALEILQAEIK